jgi:hypothetical protein
MTTRARAASETKLGTITAQVYALLLDEGLIPSVAVGEVHDLAVSIDDWKVSEANGETAEHVTTDGESWVIARGTLRVEEQGAEDGQTRLVVRGQGFLLLDGGNTPPPDRVVEVTGLLYVEPTRMPVFGFENPRALPLRRPWRVVGVRREILPRGESAGRGSAAVIERLPDPDDVDTGSYYFVDLAPA